MVRILLCGSDQNTIEHFLSRSEGDTRYLSTSSNSKDLETHILFVHPDKIICCLNENDLNSRIFLELVSVAAENNHIPVFTISEREQVSQVQTILKPNVVVKYLDLNTDFADIERTILNYDGGMPVYKEEEPETMETRAPIPSISDMGDSLEDDPDIQRLTGPERISEEGVEELEKVDRDTRLHVLIIDDSPVMLKTLKTYLEDTFDVAVALSGELALNFLSKKSTDVILLDYEMPNMSGPDVLYALRKFERTSSIPVIFLTGVSDKNKIRQVLAMKPQGYLLKPVPKDKLTEAIRHVVFGD